MATHSRPRIPALVRTQHGRKSELKALRRAGYVPGSIFGHGDPELVQVPAHDLSVLLNEHGAGAVLDLAVDGDISPVIIRELERDPVSRHVRTIGFQRVDLRTSIKLTVPIHFEGEEFLIREGLVLERQMAEVEIHGRATQLPESLTLDLTGAEAGTTFRIADLQLPKGIEATKDPDSTLARVTAPSVAPDVEAALDAEVAAHDELVASHHADEAAEGEDETIEAEETAGAASE
jgi:large subunit ribosomal protein L25